MSDQKDTDPLKDLEMAFLPSWAQEPNDAKPYADFAGESKNRGRGRGDWGDRPRRRDDNRGRDFKGRGDRPRGRDDRRDGDRRQNFQNRDGKRPPNKKGNFRRNDAPPRPPLELDASIRPERNGVEALAKQIKTSGRAYPLFDIARLIIAKGERYEVVFQTKRKEDGTVAQPLFFCQVDETIWLSKEQAIDHVLGKHFDTFYTTEKTEIEPPKGTYTFVAQCGMSDEILGPPNYHGYQEKLRNLHAERFARLPFDVFKSRVKIVRDEEVVNKWIEEQSYKTEYVTLNLPEEARLESRDAVRSHFREHHLGNLITSVDSIALKGNVYTKKSPPRMQNLVRRAFDEQRRFPLKVVNMLSQEFSSHGLQFFKRKKSVTHVSVSRPHHLDLDNTPVSESIRDIVSFITETENCTRRSVLEKFAPEPETPEAPEGAEEKPEAQLSPERTAVLSDLHWLVHQGHVIEYASGQMEVAPKPQPPQQKKKKVKEEKKAEAPAAEKTEPEATPEEPEPAGQAEETKAAAEPEPEPTAPGESQALGQAETPEPSEPSETTAAAESESVPAEAEPAVAEPAKEEASASAAE